MKPTNRLTLESDEAEWSGKSVLLLDGRRIGTVDGSHIDAQFDCGAAGLLVLVSFDHIFSAVEHIYLLDGAGRVRDRLRLGDPMEQGLISGIAVDGPDRVSFNFPMEEAHTVRVFEQTAWLGLKTRWLHLDR